MNPEEYQALALRSASTDHGSIKRRLGNSDIIDLVHAQLGISSEAGELADAVKKYVIYGRSLDTANIKEECGDLLWYIALALTSCGYSMEDCMIENIEKLRIRYPEKFTEEHAKIRLDKQGEEMD